MFREQILINNIWKKQTNNNRKQISMYHKSRTSNCSLSRSTTNYAIFASSNSVILSMFWSLWLFTQSFVLLSTYITNIKAWVHVDNKLMITRLIFALLLTQIQHTLPCVKCRKYIPGRDLSHETWISMCDVSHVWCSPCVMLFLRQNVNKMECCKLCVQKYENTKEVDET